jgi:hypothetical protein
MVWKPSMENQRPAVLRGLVLGLVASLCGSAPGEGSEPSSEAAPVDVRVLEDSWSSLVESGIGIPQSGGTLGSSVFLAGESGDPYSVPLLLDGVPLRHLQRGGFDWTGLSALAVRPGRFSQGGWSSRMTDGALDGHAGFSGRRGRLEVPVSKVAFIQGPRGYKRNGAEFGRSLAGDWGTHLSIEDIRGTPTPSSIAHETDHFGVVLEGNVRDWYTRVTVRRTNMDRTWDATDIPPDGVQEHETSRETTWMVQGRALGADRLILSLWSRGLSSVEERRTGLDLARLSEGSRGARVDLTWNIGEKHRWTLEVDVERLSHEWHRAPDRRYWRTGIWFGEEMDRWGGTGRLGVRGEYHGEWGRQPLGELGWTQPVGEGWVDVSLFHAYRTPGEFEHRYAEEPPGTPTRSGGRAEYRRGERGRESGIRLFAWEETHHPVWDTVSLEDGSGALRWRLRQDRIRAIGSLAWVRRDIGDMGRIWSSLRLRRVRGSDGGHIPLASVATMTLGGEIRIALPLRETSLVASCRGYGWSRTDLPEGGTLDPAVVLNAEAGFQISTFLLMAGIRNVLDTPVSQSPFLSFRERNNGRTERNGTVPRHACLTEREIYFGMSLVLYD